VEGTSDLTIDGKKFSGNAQRRKKRCLLFHGSFLLNFDIPLVSEILRMPPQQPLYRQNRNHDAFIRNIPVERSVIERELVRVWNARTALDIEIKRKVLDTTAELVRTKYSTGDWNRRF
jgi:lipoate---protein ligase